METANHILPAGLNVSNPVLGPVAQICAGISTSQLLLNSIILALMLVLLYHHLKLRRKTSRLAALIEHQEKTRVENNKRIDTLEEDSNSNANEIVQILERIEVLQEDSIEIDEEGVERTEELEKDFKRWRVMEWGHQMRVGKCMDCLSKRMDHISAKVECLELREDSGSVVYTPMDGENEDSVDRDELAEAMRATAGGGFGDLESESEPEYYDEDEDEAEMRAQREEAMEAEMKAELDVMMETEMYSDGELAEKEEERQRSVSKVEAYLRSHPDTSEMNNDQLELDRILGGELGVQPQKAITPFDLEADYEADADDEKEEDGDSGEDSDDEEH